MLCVPHLSHTRPCVAFPSLRISHLCVFCDFLSPKAVYRVCVPFSDARCFLPVTVYGTYHAHLVHMCWPLLWGLYQMGCISATFGTHALEVDHESAQLSRPEAVVVASPKSPASPDITPMASQPQTPAVCLHQWRVPQFALKYPCNTPPRKRETITWRPSPPPRPRGRPLRTMRGDFKGGGGGQEQHTSAGRVTEQTEMVAIVSTRPRQSLGRIIPSGPSLEHATYMTHRTRGHPR